MIRRPPRAMPALLLTLLTLIVGCEWTASWVVTGSTAGDVTVGFSLNDRDSWIITDVAVPDGTIVNWPGGDGGGEFPYCEHDKDELPNYQVTYRVTDPDGNVLWEEPISSLHLCDGDRVLWDGTELRKLQADEPWPDQLER